MSRTDKDRPYWVQLRDPDFPWPVKEHHNHWWPGSGARPWECDLGFPLPRTRRKWRNCEIWIKWRFNDKVYGRSGWRRRHPGQEGRARAVARRLRRDWIKTVDREDIDSYADAPSQRWLWRRWYWD